MTTASQDAPRGPDAATTTRGPAQHPSTAPLDVSSVLAQYGQAMLRLGQLEKELEQLRDKVQAAPAQDNSKSALTYEATIQEKDRLLRLKDETIASLRGQLSLLNTQFAKTEEKLKLAAEGAYMMHRRRRRRWWRFWRWLG